MQQRTTVSIIITAIKNSKLLLNIIDEAKKVSRNAEILILFPARKSTDKKTAAIPGVRTINLNTSSYKASRQRIANCTSGKVLLFLQDNCVIPADVLQKFVQTVRKGWDVALSTRHEKGNPNHVQPIEAAKTILNQLVNRADLASSSMIDYPHALSKKALDVILKGDVSTAPNAHVTAIRSGLSFTTIVLAANGRDSRNHLAKTSMLLGDHLEAIAYVIRQTDARGGNPDFDRERELLTVPMKSHLRRIITGGEDWQNFW